MSAASERIAECPGELILLRDIVSPSRPATGERSRWSENARSETRMLRVVSVPAEELLRIED